MTVTKPPLAKRSLLRFASERAAPGFGPMSSLHFGGSVIKYIAGSKKRAMLAARAGLEPVLGRLGSLEVRLATTLTDVRRAQRLRFKVFYEEMSAIPNGASLLSRRDLDDYDD